MTTTPSTNDSGLNLDHLEALARAATPGRWMRLFGERTVYDRMEDGCRGNAIVRADLGYGPQDISNLDFIAAANPAAVLELIDLARGATQPAAAPTHCDPAEGFCAACREQERAAQAPTVPATLPDAAALMYNALNDAYQSSVFDGEELRQVVRALAAYNRSRSGPAALAHQPAQEQAEPCPYCGGKNGQHDAAYPHPRSAQQEPVAAPQQNSASNSSNNLLAEVLAEHDQRTRVETAAMGVDLAPNPLMERVRAAVAAQQAAAPGTKLSSAWEMGLEDSDGNPLAIIRADQLRAAGDFIETAALVSVRIDGRDVSRKQMAASMRSYADCAQDISAPSAPGTPEAPKKPAHGHRDDYYLLANGRRLGLEPISRVRNMPNWVLAMELFATGSTSARQLCRDAGVDPDSTAAQRAAQLDGGQEGSGHASS